MEKNLSIFLRTYNHPCQSNEFQSSASRHAVSAHMQQANLVIGLRAVFRRLELVGGILSQSLLQALSLLTFCFDPWQQAGYGWIFLLWLLLVIVGAYKLLCIRSGWSCADSGGFS